MHGYATAFLRHFGCSRPEGKSLYFNVYVRHGYDIVMFLRKNYFLFLTQSTDRGQGRRNRGDDIKSALFPKAKCPHLFLEMFSKKKF